MILFINTNSKEEIKLFLTNDLGELLFSKIEIIDFKDSQKILNLIDVFIKESKSTLKEISNLVIVNGPGINMNFRIGIIVTNALAYTLNIKIASILSTQFKSDEEFIKIGIEKINKKDYQKIILPEYSIKKG